MVAFGTLVLTRFCIGHDAVLNYIAASHALTEVTLCLGIFSSLASYIFTLFANCIHNMQNSDNSVRPFIMDTVSKCVSLYETSIASHNACISV